MLRCPAARLSAVILATSTIIHVCDGKRRKDDAERLQGATEHLRKISRGRTSARAVDVDALGVTLPTVESLSELMAQEERSGAKTDGLGVQGSSASPTADDVPGERERTTGATGLSSLLDSGHALAVAGEPDDDDDDDDDESPPIYLDILVFSIPLTLACICACIFTFICDMPKCPCCPCF
eukprot:TRINITY_DN3740_c0_g1_i1.p1 TRINITY_DN3740_c0_g1~~TRINITY_DN3740_c0_g1_i1.p1  ORF type:complete len:181 (-),score=20.09 TRINITY_DN3740_c0_g1_i1:222-764(-)